jgi:hypothetical protein
MINIQISTEIPKFFRELHMKSEKVSFESYVLEKIKNIKIPLDTNILNNLIENFKFYNEIQIRIPIYGNSINFFGNCFVFDEKNNTFTPSDYFPGTGVSELNLIDGYIYSEHMKISQVPMIQIKNELIKKLNFSEVINLFSSKQFLSEYVELIDKVNLNAEMKLYEEWILFNLNIINK